MAFSNKICNTRVRVLLFAFNYVKMLCSEVKMFFLFHFVDEYREWNLGLDTNRKKEEKEENNM